MRFDLRFAALPFVFLGMALHAFAGDIVINEVMYRPPVETNQEEFVELYNRSAHVVDLTGWRFTKGVRFAFTNSTLLAPGGYVVVVQNLAAFQAKHPGVTNCLGNWDGILGNSGQTIELDDAFGTQQDSLQYADDGDWATRVKAPADLGHRGWVWGSDADGGGMSLELINPALPNKYGQNWASSLGTGGTPGQANSVNNANIPPLVLDVHHTPLVPKSTEPVVVTARLLDEVTNGIVATLFYRRDGGGGYSSVAMLDDGVHGDGAAGDGVFGASIPPQTNNSVVEFYVTARDGGNNFRSWPAPALVDDVSSQSANLLYQVDDTAAYAGSQPFYRLILRAADLVELQQINTNAAQSQSQAKMNGTFISMDGIETELRYNVGVRNRSHDSAHLLPQGYEVSFENAQSWKGTTGLRLNTQYTPAQLAGNAIIRRAGLVTAEARAVQVRVNNNNYTAPGMPVTGTNPLLGFFVHGESWDGDLVSHHFPQDASGNLYAGFDDAHSLTGGANLAYLGANPDAYRTNGHYFKHTNVSLDDWSDLIGLTATLNLTPDSNYTAAVSESLNVDEWLSYLALNVLLDNKAASPASGYGHNYYLYRGVNDPRFQILPYDLDNILNSGATAGSVSDPILPSASLPVIDKLVKWPDFAPRYYGNLKRLMATTMSPTELNPLLDQTLTGLVPSPTIAAMKTFATQRVAYVLSQMPLSLTVTSSAPVVSGYPRATTSSVTLSGQANIIDTRSVLVAGTTSSWTAWQGRWTNTFSGLQPGVNRLLVRSLNADGREVARTNIDIWYDAGPAQTFGGSVTEDTILSAGNGPYRFTTTLTVASGVTLTIEPGTTIYLDSGVNLEIADGGRLLAEGTETEPIRFTRMPGTSVSWGGINIHGSVGSPETRISYAHIEYNGAIAIHSFSGTSFAGHLTFGTPSSQYMWYDGASEIVADCVFPTPTAVFEPIDSVNGIKAGGHALFLRNFFGKPFNYEDVIDFTGGNRPGTTNQPLAHFIGNVFMGSDDDGLDLDGTDAWVEGNIFLHFHRNGTTPDSSSAVSGGVNQTGVPATSEITIVNNLFFDCDQVADAKEGNFFTLLNNTIVHITKTNGIDFDSGVVCVRDTTPSPSAFGKGYYLEGNVIADVEKLVRNYDSNQTTVTFSNNILPLAWAGPGGGNRIANPRLKHIPQVSETHFTSWQDAQVMWDWFSLLPDSPARGTGPDGKDMGGVVARGAALTGIPAGTTWSNSATIRVGFDRTGNGIPTAGFPGGSGYTSYQWRLDSGAWSALTPITTPISLSGLANGPHYVEVIGLDDAYLFQNDARLGETAKITRSANWTVDTGASRLLINEVLAKNVAAVLHGGVYPDLVELYNDGPTNRDLSGMGFTDNATNKFKFVFPAGTVIGSKQYLMLYADKTTAAGEIHLGFAVSQSGQGLYLYDAAARGGALLDAVQFGLQIADYSIGRLADSTWGLTKPTFGAINVAQPLWDPSLLKINEWLAHGQNLFTTDFIELYNPASLPVALGGLYLTDNPVFLADNPAQITGLSGIAPLSFIPAGGFARFIADGAPEAGADHVGFKLNADQGMIGLFDSSFAEIDIVLYGPQRTDVSQGRSPNGGDTFAFFTQPTPEAGNPGLSAGLPLLVLNEIIANNSTITNGDGTVTDWVEFYNPSNSVVNLSDLSLTDDLTVPRRWVFPTNTVVAAHGFLLVRADGDAPSSATNTGFGLKAGGGGVYLFDAVARGGGLLDAITFGLQIRDHTIARVPDGSGAWALGLPTPAAPNVAAVVSSAAGLKVNEWMADPVAGEDWFELYNSSANPVDLGGLVLSDNLNDPTISPVPPRSFIGTGADAFAFFNADGSPASGAAHANFKLSKSGEAIGIFTTDAVLIDGITFGAQQTGVSQGRFPDGAPAVVSFPRSPTPGESNYLPLTNAVVNEVLTHTDPPLEDAVELYNPTAVAANIGGWYLSNSHDDFKKFRVPDGTIIPAHGFKVIYEYQFNPTNGSSLPFTLNSAHGDAVLLSGADALGNLTGYRAVAAFGAAVHGVSFGRFTNSVGSVDYVALTARSFGVDNPASLAEFRAGTGAANAYPLVGPVVINEIMFHPPGTNSADNTHDEYIELSNVTPVPVPLYDPNALTNTWKISGGVDYTFPQGIILGSNAFLLLVNFDPLTDVAGAAAFRSRYGLTNVALYGPYEGHLANSGETVALYQPDPPQLPPHPDAGFVPYVRVEQIDYLNAAPWPANADGTGRSLQRLIPLNYGNDPANWAANTPTAASLNSPAATDVNGDGLPDAWQLLYFVSVYDPNAAPNADPDGDGFSNLREYLAGTDPTNPASSLQVKGLVMTGTTVKLRVPVVAGHSYTLQSQATLGGTWNKVLDIPTGSQTIEVEVIDPNPFLNGARYYRVISPALP